MAVDVEDGPRSGWQTQLRSRGYRLTPQRQLVLEAVARLGHATPEEIVTEVHRTAGGVNISTVYRTLELLEKLKLVSHAHLRHGAPAYHAAGAEDHVHLVCGACGAVQEVSPNVLSDLVIELRERLGFTVDVNHVALTGRCVDCAGPHAG
ncbi:Fur family transcriptional regulator [Frankia sp. CiP3]|uniref:Fur family transcriptional regulator n=1 Tax=Frankia sp. CiP3 TaxID=2880971 RepID=UPI001EF70841|nr:transcriptional repressor [Frankia sp. CiP3]